MITIQYNNDGNPITISTESIEEATNVVNSLKTDRIHFTITGAPVVHVKCIYFKPSGKYFTHAEGDVPFEVLCDCIYPREAGRVLNELKLLPGLNGTWDGPFTITVSGPWKDRLGEYTELYNPPLAN